MVDQEHQCDRITAIQQDLRRALKALNDEDKQVPEDLRVYLLKAESDLADVIFDLSVTLAHVTLEGLKK